MKSPFPGMDPFIEACGLWAGFHHHLVEAIYRTLAASLPDRYSIDIGVRTYVVLLETEGKKAHRALPDVGVSEPRTGRRPPRSGGGVALAEPTEAVMLRAFVAEEFKESFIEIHLADEEQTLVTSVEVLSPSNKKENSEGWNEYLRKRQPHLLGQANLVEIDLLRGGTRLPMLDTWPDSPYSLLVCRMTDAPYCRVWPAYMHRPLPHLSVPLFSPDPDLTVDLQRLIDDIYTLGRYHKSIDYKRPLRPAPTAAERRAAGDLLPPSRPRRRGKSS